MTSQPIELHGSPASDGGTPTWVWHALAWLGRLVVAGLFLYAAAIKIVDPQAFATDIRGYEIFPTAATNAMAFLIPWVEVSTAVLLLVGVWRREARWLIICMLAAFTVLKVYALATGHDLNCGCFGDSFMGRISVGWVGVWLNVGMLVLLIVEGYAAARLAREARPAARPPAGAS